MLFVCSAMGGSVKFEDALQMRLAVMKSSHQNIQDFLAAHPPRISKGDIVTHCFVCAIGQVL